MPDTLTVHLSPVERITTAERLWKIIAMCDAGRSTSDIRDALKYMAQDIEPPNYMAGHVPRDQRSAA